MVRQRHRAGVRQQCLCNGTDGLRIGAVQPRHRHKRGAVRVQELPVGATAHLGVETWRTRLLVPAAGTGFLHVLEHGRGALLGIVIVGAEARELLDAASRRRTLNHLEAVDDRIRSAASGAGANACVRFNALRRTARSLRSTGRGDAGERMRTTWSSPPQAACHEPGPSRSGAVPARGDEVGPHGARGRVVAVCHRNTESLPPRGPPLRAAITVVR